MKAKNYEWLKIANVETELSFANNNLTVIEVNGKKITLGKYMNQLFACAHTCPHAGGILSDGYIDATGNIVCPVHGYKFKTKNGRNTSGEGFFLKTYPVKLNEEGVFLGMDEKGFRNFF